MISDHRKHAGGGPEILRESMDDHAAAGVPSQRLIPSPEEARRAQEAATMAHRSDHDSRRTRIADAWLNDPWFPRTLVQHEEILRNWPTSPNGTAAKEAYMKAAGIVYAEGGLFWATDLEAPKPASPTKDVQSQSMYGQAQGVAQMLRAPGKMFSRSDILAIIRGQIAAWKDGGGDMEVGKAIAAHAFIHIFENLE